MAAPHSQTSPSAATARRLKSQTSSCSSRARKPPTSPAQASSLMVVTRLDPIQTNNPETHYEIPTQDQQQLRAHTGATGPRYRLLPARRAKSAGLVRRLRL